jgi:hypothetical protein
MDSTRKQYQAPALVDQGDVVEMTLATPDGECWDGSPYQDDDTRTCKDDEVQLQ